MNITNIPHRFVYSQTQQQHKAEAKENKRKGTDIFVPTNICTEKHRTQPS